MLDLDRQDASQPAPPELRLLTELEPWPRVFARNLLDVLLLRQPPYVVVTSRPGRFWPDVFVDDRLPRRGLVQSILWHALLVVSIYGLTLAWMPPPLTQARLFRNTTITYYSVSEYLPPIDSGSEPAPVAKKGEPAPARQKVISLPRHPDNSRQTIVDPSTPRILREPKPLPNIVAWADPAPVVPVSELTHRGITLPADVTVVAPAVQAGPRQVSQMRNIVPAQQAVQPSVQAGSRDLARLDVSKLASQGVVEPIASAEAVTRKLGDLNIGRYQQAVAAPKLPVAEQRSTGAAGSGSAGVAASAPVAPSVGGGSGVARPAGRLIALGLDPVAPNGPIEMPGGNRSGIFAAGPEGKPGAPGTPDIAGGGNGAGGHGDGDAGAGAGRAVDIPAGITVAGGLPNPLSAIVAGPAVAAPFPPVPPAPSPARTIAPKAFPTISPASVTDLARRTAPGARVDSGKIEDEVFGPKRYYTMSLNMPNLTSASGTWIMRFAELKDSPDKADLTAPIATVKVDPAYPAELIRENVEGTVTLYAVIHADGTVGEVKVLRGVDHRLDENARVALARWHFQPATKHGSAIDLEAVVQIPFRLRRVVY